MVDERPVVFVGPSLPRNRPFDEVVLKPPAVYGDFDILLGKPNPIAVFLDGGFLSKGAVTHFELGNALQNGVRLIGAASAGALRAAELRSYGMIGVGIAFQALLAGIIVDDSELAVGMCPTTYRALTIPLINLRRFLFDALQDGHPQRAVDEAWRLAAEIYFLARTPAAISHSWNTPITRDLGAMFKARSMSEWNVKESDTMAAITYAQKLAAGDVGLQVPVKMNLITNRLPT